MNRMRSVLIEQDTSASTMGHKETIRPVLVIKVPNCLLQSGDVTFPGNVLLDGSFFSTSGSWVPIADVELLLLGQAIGHIGVKTVFRIGWRISVLCLTKNGIGTV